jgi:hypothetical protein
MNEIKLSPLLLFLILLIVLVIATTVKRWGLVSEGFLSYLKSQNNFSSQTVRSYDSSSSIIKLYDDIFFDQRNGNLVIVSGSQYVSTEDTDGSSIVQVDIVSRNPKTTEDYVSYKKGSNGQTMTQVSDESKRSTIEVVDTQWCVKSLTTSNQICYITWGNDTYLYTIDLTNASIAGNSIAGNSVAGNTATTYSGTYKHTSISFFNGSTMQSSMVYAGESPDVQLKSTYSYSNSGTDDTNIMVDLYDNTTGKTVYQLMKSVWFDYRNGNLIVQSKRNGNEKEIGVFYRDYGHLANPTPDVKYTTVLAANADTPASKRTFSSTTSKPYFIQDALDGHTIMYWPSGDNTILVVFKNYLETGLIRPVKCRRFTRDGLYGAAAPAATATAASAATAAPPAAAVATGENSELLDAFSRWYIYFNANAVGSGDSSDYLLKTQIVPPVCPACPGCQGVCTSCGGNGGSGTLASDNNSLAFKGNTAAQTSNGTSTSNNTLVGSTGSFLNNAVDATGNVANKTIDTAGNVVNKTIDTAGNVVGKTFDTATNLVGKTFDAAGNLLESTANRLGADRTGYYQSYGGPKNTSTSANAVGYRPGSNSTGVSTLPNSNPQDPYSYNGALQSKGGNYMSITADFSKFGR